MARTLADEGTETWGRETWGKPGDGGNLETWGQERVKKLNKDFAN